jgi:ankyrin repeat protein
MVELMLAINKVEVDLKDGFGQTPLLWAAQNRHEAVVKLLLETGKVEVDLKSEFGQTPLSFAA